MVLTPTVVSDQLERVGAIRHKTEELKISVLSAEPVNCAVAGEVVSRYVRLHLASSAHSQPSVILYPMHPLNPFYAVELILRLFFSESSKLLTKEYNQKCSMKLMLKIAPQE
jgi:hypothetical protein